MILIVFPRASAEVDDAFEYYYGIRPSLGFNLLTEFRQGIDQIIAHPLRWQPLDDAVRRFRLRRFPYGIVYHVESSKSIIQVIAFMHLSQHPEIWRGRTA